MSLPGDNNPYPPPIIPGPGGYGTPPDRPYIGEPRVRFEAIGEAWQLFTQQMGTWVGAMFILVGAIVVFYFLYVGVLFGLIAAVGGMQPNMNPNAPIAPPSAGAIIGLIGGMALMGLLLWVGSQYLMGGLFRLALKQVRGEPISINDMFTETASLPTLLLSSLLVAIASMFGALLCILPAYIVSGLFMLTTLIAIDQRVGATEAMSRSWNALKSDWLMATLFLFVLSLLASLGGLACGIGMVFTVPLFFLGQAIVYRDFFLVSTAPFNPDGYPYYPPNAPYPNPPGYGTYPPPVPDASPYTAPPATPEMTPPPPPPPAPPRVSEPHEENP